MHENEVRVEWAAIPGRPDRARVLVDAEVNADVAAEIARRLRELVGEDPSLEPREVWAGAGI